MYQNTISGKVNKNICEASGCFAEATKNVEVQIGQKGIISLHLCESCLAKFRDN
jgi:hypothetical protein